MPDTWEFPWYTSWDLAFHCVTLAAVDPEFAKSQLVTLTREWYMHPNGQLPAYEWAFGDVNPPVHARAAWQVYQIDRQLTGTSDLAFLERVFHKLMLICSTPAARSITGPCAAGSHRARGSIRADFRSTPRYGSNDASRDRIDYNLQHD